MALAPGLTGAGVALVGIPAIASDFFYVVGFVISVVALIAGWFALQSDQWGWLPLPAGVAALWNPVLPLTLDDGYWLVLHHSAALVFILVGLVIRVPSPPPSESKGRS